MRIGEVNKDNYMQLLKMFSGKSSPALNAMSGSAQAGGAQPEKTQAEIHAEWAKIHARLVKTGAVEDGMDIELYGNNGAYKKTVPVSDEIKDKLIATVRRQFVDNGNGMSDAKDGDEIGAMMKEYRKNKNIPPKDRLSVTWTLEQIVMTETQRIMDALKAGDPAWKNGDTINPEVLAQAVSNSNAGLDVKA